MGIIHKNIYIEKEDYYILKITSNKHGVFDLMIDKEDYDRCKNIHWSINHFNKKSENGYFYAVNNKIGLLHRFLMNVSKDVWVDHASGNSLDNRKSNIRTCSIADNNRNRKFMNNNTSGKVGVCWSGTIPTPKWLAYIKIDNKRKHLGYFEKYEDAVKAREKAELKYFGEFAPSINEVTR